MRHDRLPEVRHGSILARKRFQFVGALAIGALLPWAMRSPLPGSPFEAASINALVANIAAVIIALWMRLSIETYPGIQRAYVILPAALTGHGVTLVWFVLTRLPYDRLALGLGFLLHVAWLFLLYLYAERGHRQRIAVVPFGDVERLQSIDVVSWQPLARPRINDARGCDAIVADFSADLPTNGRRS
jgi:hypothetical protein